MDERVKKILICPACHGNVTISVDKIVCSKCGKTYTIDDKGKPNLIINREDQCR